MPSLGDFVGKFLSEITIARMHADIEAVRVAELYAGHPLLRHMPVPHFRLPDVRIDVPVVIKEMEEPRPDQPPRGAPTISVLRKAFDEVMTKWLRKERVRLSADDKEKLESILDETVDAISQPLAVAVDVERVAVELSAAVSRTLTESAGPLEAMEPAQVKKLEKKLKDAARIEFLKLHKPPPRLHVLVTTAEIREAGPSETITRLQLKITEEGFEWTTIEFDGREQDRLVPE